MSEFHVCGISQSADCAAHPSLKMGTHQKTPLCTIADAADRAPERLPQLIPSVGMSIRPIMFRLPFSYNVASVQSRRRQSESPKSILVAKYSCWDSKFRMKAHSFFQPLDVPWLCGTVKLMLCVCGKIIFVSFLRSFQCWVFGAVLDIQSWNPSAKLNIYMSSENAVWTTIPTSHL